jgi:esterase
MAGDIAETLKKLDISKAIVIGYSMGARVAMEFALSMPESVEKLVLVDLSPMAEPAPGINVILSAMLNLDLTLVKAIDDADVGLKDQIPVSKVANCWVSLTEIIDIYHYLYGLVSVHGVSLKYVATRVSK